MAYGFTNIILSKENFRLKNFYNKRFDRNRLRYDAVHIKAGKELSDSTIKKVNKARMLNTIRIVGVFIVSTMLAIFFIFNYLK